MTSSRPILRLVPGPGTEQPQVHFCGHCGQAPPTPTAARSRVCALCGLGVVIAAGEDLAPRAGEPFVIVDRRLMVCGVSRSAEKLLGVLEPTAVDRAIGEFLEPADAEAGQGDELLRCIAATAGGGPACSIVLRPSGEYGVRYAARVGRCGPPTGALIVLAGV